jgi:hypothetical protein
MVAFHKISVFHPIITRESSLGTKFLNGREATGGALPATPWEPQAAPLQSQGSSLVTFQTPVH